MLVVKNRVQYSDIVLAKKLSEEIFNDYKTALEFAFIEPKTSYLMFRRVLELLCFEIGKKHNIELNPNSLYKNISILATSLDLEESLIKEFHSLRIMTNKEVHRELISLKELKENDELDIGEVRNKLVKIFGQVYYFLNKEKVEIEISKLSEFEFNKSVLDSTKDLRSSEKYKAGLWYEAQVNKKYNSFGTASILPEVDTLQIKMLIDLALTHYEVSYKLSVYEGLTWQESIYVEYNKDALVDELCNIEYYFKYARLIIANSNLFKDDEVGKAVRMMKNAMARGHELARVYYSCRLYEEAKYEDAYNLICKSIRNEKNSLSYNLLFHYYSDGKACTIDKEKALEYLSLGIEEGDLDALTKLGKLYYEGVIVDKNELKGKEILEEAIAKGNRGALQYYNMEIIHGGAKKISKKISKTLISQYGHLLEERPDLAHKKIDRNSLCFCGSGKKYKKCCFINGKKYNKDTSKTQKIGL